jgi:hypothetical protein
MDDEFCARSSGEVLARLGEGVVALAIAVNSADACAVAVTHMADFLAQATAASLEPRLAASIEASTVAELGRIASAYRWRISRSATPLCLCPHR